MPHRGPAKGALGAGGKAAARRRADAVRLADYRPGAADQPGGGRARAEACGEDRLDAGARRRRVAQAPQIDPGHDIARPARPG